MAVNRIAIERTWKDLHSNVKRGVLALKENATIEDGKVISSTGKDVSHLVELVPKVTPRQSWGLSAVSELAEHETDNGGFVFALFSRATTMAEQFPELSQPDLARLMFIGTYVAWETNRLQYDNGRIIRKKGLEELVDMSTKRFNEFYKRLLAENIIEEQGEEIFVNPSVFYRGELKNIGYDVSHLQHTRMFRKTVRDLYSQFNSRTIKQLAIIYSVLPFLNFNTNIVCFNPEETDSDLLKPMNLENLAALLGYQDTHKLKRALDTIKVDGKPVFWLPENVNDKRQRRIIVNPNVIYGGDAKSLAGIKVLFS